MLYDVKMNRFGILFYGLIGVITWLAVAPLHVPQVNPDWGDKVNHAAAFAVLFVAGYLTHRRIFCLWAGLVAYGVFIEVLQSFLPFRFASAEDVAADIAGIALGHFAVFLLKRSRWLGQKLIIVLF